MSQFDELVLDDKVLDEIANFIIIYCNNQQGIINDYLQKMNSLSNEWQDDETMGKVLQEVRTLTRSVERIMDIIRFKYPQHFRERAELIRAKNKIQLP